MAAMDTATHSDAPPVASGVEPSVPPVVAVVVTCDPGWWLEDCLASLAQQDYPQLSVLIVDADSTEDPTPRIAAVMPNAYVRRTKRRRGFGTAANEVLGVVEGASHYVFCHDDVVLARSAVRLMMAEALKSNAGVVAPKLVGWYHPDRLLAVGMGADAFGVPVAVADRGDLDQEQHDMGRDVFFAPAPCTLVRADLFASLGGFDPGYGALGEDLDLSWRAHLAGARVVNAPSAAVAHLEATEAGQRALDGHLRATGEGESGPIVSERAARPVTAEPDSSEMEPAEPPDSGAAGHHATWRARRSAQREFEHEEMSTGTEWELEEWEPRRRPRRRLRPPAPAATRQRGPDAETMDDLRDAARLRAIASNYGWMRLLAHLPTLFALALLRAVAQLTRRDRAGARRTLRPWGALLTQSGSVRKRRQAARRSRAVPDSEVVAYQTKRPAWVRDALRIGPAPEGDADRRLSVVVWVSVLAVLLVGTRHLLAGTLPTLGEFAPWPALHTLASEATSGWRLTGLGVAGPAPTAFGLFALAGAVFLGHMTVLQHVVVLGMLPAGVFGMARLAKPLGSRRAQAVAVVAYAAIPLPYNALATGGWSGLVAYGAFPWLIAMLAAVSGLEPFAVDSANTRRYAVALAVLVALVAAIAPGTIPVVVLVGALLGRRTLVPAVAGAAGALVLLFPWAISWLPPGGEWAMVTGVSRGPSTAMHLATLFRFQTGPLGAGILGYAIPVAAALPLLVGRDWRSNWAIRLWVVAFASIGCAWLGQHGALGAVWPPVDVLLVPAAAALALAAGLGMAAFDTDLRGTTFGWRQVVAGVAAAAALLGCLPILVATAGGRWHQPTAGFDTLLSWMPDQRVNGDFRVLWVGAPDVLPLAGWQDGPGVAYATSVDGPPTLTDRWPGTSVGTTNLLGQAVELVRRGNTTEVGHLLAPMGVRYIVVVQAAAPMTRSGSVRAAPPGLSPGLNSQLDLRLIDQSPAATVYENSAWVPSRSAVPDGEVTTAELDDPRAARTAELGPPAPVVTHQPGPTTFTGTAPTGSAIELAQAPSGHWQMTVSGHSVARRPAFGSANLFTVGRGGNATISYRTPLGWWAAYLLELALWVAAIRYLIHTRRRRRVGG